MLDRTKNRNSPKTVALFCGSRSGNDADFTASTQALVAGLIRKGHPIVFGGGKSGLMGTIGQTAGELRGTAIGVIPEFLKSKEGVCEGLTELVTTQTMHERKWLMSQRASASIALPGGWGTLDEVIEILTWRQLGLISHKVIFFNVNGFYDPLMTFFDSIVRAGFLTPEARELAVFCSKVDEVLLSIDL